MIHELKEIIHQAVINQQKGLKNVLATVVFLEGSSYRKPGVRMLIAEDLSITGAVSGGCVEKEIIQRAQTVFMDNQAKIISYDGRYRLGCEGILYILIEPFFVEIDFLKRFSNAIEKQEIFEIYSFFIKNDEVFGRFGSQVIFQNQEVFSLHKNFSFQDKNQYQVFTQILKPAFKLLIIGGEHDAVKLCKIAANLGWDITVITSAKDPKSLNDFPGAASVIAESPEKIQFENSIEQMAIVIMNHSYVQDLKFLQKLSIFRPKYIGILGALGRGERMFNELFEQNTDIDLAFLEAIYTPAGLHLGAQTPEEIAIAIIAEIMAVFNNKDPFSLRNLKGKMHQ